MSDYHQVTRICKRTVVSTKAVQQGKSYPLSVLNHLMEKSHLRIVFYYRSGGGPGIGEVTKKLRESASELLTFFPIVTGRLVKDDEGRRWTIKYNDAGMRMVEARVKGSVDDWLLNVDREKELSLIHWEDMPDYDKSFFWSPFYVQLTEFEEGGLAVGLSCAHLLADPICATMFIKAWADTTLAGTMISPPHFHPLPLRRQGNKDPNHKLYTDLINHYKSLLETNPSVPVTTKSTKPATVAFSFSDQMVRACMDMARTNDPFEALSSLFWICLSKVKGDNEGLIGMSICLDARKVLGLDKGFFGSCMVYNKVNLLESSSSNLDNNNKLAMASNAISKVMVKMDNEGIMDLIEWLEGNHKECAPPMMNGTSDLICVNLEGVDSYKAVFEHRFDPIRVSYCIEPVSQFGQVLVLAVPNRDFLLSRVVMVTLPEDEMVKLCQDELILGFSPTKLGM
ncbi:hypothetical protein ACFE04_016406 [Oxalis oulophora]